MIQPMRLPTVGTSYRANAREMLLAKQPLLVGFSVTLDAGAWHGS